jgi:hypothetical protein
MSRSIVRAARKILRPVLRQLLAQGWTLTLTGSGHIRAASPSGELVFMALTPSDSNAVRNMLPRLRRAGFNQKGQR